jgi:hypothetical protein
MATKQEVKVINQRRRRTARRLLKKGMTTGEIAVRMDRPEVEIIAICYGHAAVEEWDSRERPLATEGTFHIPGTRERIEVYARRAFLGQQVFHPDDCNKWSREPEAERARSHNEQGSISRLESQVVCTIRWNKG